MRSRHMAGQSMLVTRPALLWPLLLLLGQSLDSTANAAAPSQPEQPKESQRLGVAELAEVEPDTLRAWVVDLTWLTEQLHHDIRIANSERARQVDSLSRRLESAELLLSWERENKNPWWEPWLLPVAVTIGVVAGAASAR